LSRTSRLTFLTEEGRPLDAPIEWTRGLVAIDCDAADWRLPTLTRNGIAMPLQVGEIGGRILVTARWPLSGAGHYELLLRWADGSWEELRLCTVAPRKLDAAEVELMLDDLQHHLPASIAIALQRAGALAGVDLVPAAETTLAEELHRLTRAIDGTQARAGLANVLTTLGRNPYGVLRAERKWADRHTARRIDPTRLAEAFRRGGNVGADGLPEAVPVQPVAHACDVYENQLLKTFHEQVNVRMRAVARAFERRDPVNAEAQALLARLATGRRQAAFLDDVRPLSEPPSRVTMLLLKQAEYRAALEGFLELHRRMIVHLREPAVEAPFENLPFLYETWSVLEIVATTLNLAADLAYEVRSESLCVREPGELWIRLLRNGRPAVVLAHPASAVEVRITPQRRYTANARAPLGSISFDQVPDLAVELAYEDGIDVYVFDPKYKLQSDDGVDIQDRPKKVDVDAMHAYRDAIRDAAGAHVVRHAALLYPGDDQSYGSGLAAWRARPEDADRLRASARSVLEPALRAGASGRRMDDAEG
jgi:hypothetical protein